MFPNIAYLIEYITGYHPHFLSFIQTFGFFFGLCFLISGYVLYKGLQYYEQIGKIKTITITKNVRNDFFMEHFFNVIIYALLGYKILYIAQHWNEFLNDSQAFLLSKEGSILGLIIGLAVSSYYFVMNFKKLPPSEKSIVTIEQKPAQLTVNFIMIAAIAGIIGAKLFHNFEYWDDFMKDPFGQLVSFSGLTFYGGLIFAALSIMYYARKNEINLWYLADIVAPVLMLGYSIGRMGCHLSGDGDWGIENQNPNPFTWLPNWLWSSTYPHNVIEEGVPIANCIGKYCMQLPNPVYPTPLYESIVCFCLFLLLIFLRKKIQHIPGLLISIYLILNGIERFSIEQIRVNPDVFGTAYTQAMIIAICLVAAGIVLAVLSILRNRYPNK